MNTIAKIAHNGTILSWQIAGVDVLTPEHTNEQGESRGGAPLCVPMFSVQQRPVPGCDLSLHGVLMYEPREPVAEIAAGQSWRQTHAFAATENFAWEWSATLEVTLTEDSLLYVLTVARSQDCQNPDEMPVSLAFHPYFATYGEDFSFAIGEERWNKDTLPENIIDSAFAKYTEGETVTLTTAKGTVSMTSDGFDEYCLWSDNVDEYFCIEPIYQYREFGLPDTGLQPGEEKRVICKLSCTLL